MTTPFTDVQEPWSAELWEALGRYAAGESSAAERAAVHQWLARDARRGELLRALQDATAAAATPEDIDVDAAWRRFQVRRDEAVVGQIRPRVGGMVFRAAAAVVLLAGAALLWRGTHPTANRSLAAQTFTAPVGRSDSLVLVDGTGVLLAPGSRLDVAAGYGRSVREVTLQGEALFVVVHDTARPFRVRAGAALVQDLGTEFAVRSDAGDGGVQVVVRSGSVRLERAGAPAAESVTLTAGDRGALGAAGPARAEQGAARPDDFAWTGGRLVFEDASLGRVSADLRRWYGIELRITDSAVARRHLTATFTGDPAPRVLEVIALALGATIERRGDTAVFRGIPRDAGRR